jgi:hypothetical protein
MMFRVTTFFASALALVAGCSSGSSEAPRADETARDTDSLSAASHRGPEADPCAAVRCRAGTECVVVDGSATCAESDTDINPCAAVTCLVGNSCEVIDGEPACVPVDASACAAVSCLEGNSCEIVDGEPVCVPVDASACAAVLCGPGTTCQEVDGEGVCTPSEPAGPSCGGFAGLLCPGSGICVDDASDDCDPENGGADCGGQCECNILALCVEGFVFDDSPNVCACVEQEPEVDACATVRCRAGTECVVVDGNAECQPVAPSECAAVLCEVGSICEVVDGQAQCTPIESGPFCGGFGGIQCPGSGICVDDASDDCDPENGGADCGGQCECNIRALCIPGFVFDESAAVCECVPEPETNPCALVDCFPNQICEVQEGEAVCVPVTTNPCAAVLCPVDTVCIVDGDEARCEPAHECN